MDPVITLIVALAAIYLIECLIWARRNAVVFVRWLGRTLAPRAPEGPFGNSRGAFVFAPPLPPLGELFVSEPWPISVSPEGVHSWTMTGLDPGSRRVDAEAYVPFEALRAASTDGRVVLVEGRRFATCSSSLLAARLARLLAELAALPKKKRARAIEAALAESLDPAPALARIEAYRSKTRALRVQANLLFVYLVWLVPAVFWLPWFVGLGLWIFLGAGLALALSIHFGFWRAHRALYPELGSERRFRLLAMLLSPPDTARVLTHLSRELLGDRHPLAVAAAAGAGFEGLAEQFVRDGAHPAPLAASSPEAEAALAWHRDALGRAVDAAVERQSLSPARYRQAPTPQGDALHSYCPRCHEQYLPADGECDDCAGVGLVKLAR